MTRAHHRLQDDTRDLVWLTLSHMADRTLAEVRPTIDVAVADIPMGMPTPNALFANNWGNRHAD